MPHFISQRVKSTKPGVNIQSCNTRPILYYTGSSLQTQAPTFNPAIHASFYITAGQVYKTRRQHSILQYTPHFILHRVKSTNPGANIQSCNTRLILYHSGSSLQTQAPTFNPAIHASFYITAGQVYKPRRQHSILQYMPHFISQRVKSTNSGANIQSCNTRLILYHSGSSLQTQAQHPILQYKPQFISHRVKSTNSGVNIQS